MIAKRIYEGATAQELGLPAIQYNSRKETVDLFLAQWSGRDFETDFLAWLNKSNQGQEPSLELPPMAEQVKNLYRSGKDILKSGVKREDEHRHRDRVAICQRCDRLIDGRCMVCGCYMKLKAKFSVMRCPLNRWSE